MYARITTIHSPRERMDKGIEEVRKDVLPLMREVEGFRGLVGLVDRRSNMGITISLWDSEDAMQESEDVGDRLRARAAEAMKAETEPMVNRYEVVLYEVESPQAAPAR
jgi:heme-degrading monooxygenase HmoA